MELFNRVLSFYKIPSPTDKPETDKERFKRVRIISFLTATLGYGVYYVCRLSMNVIRKPMVEEGFLSETQIGIIGSCLFFTYAIGKLCNGFIADRSNVKRLMVTGLLVSALVNLILGFTDSFFLFALFWGINGFFQSMGAASGVVSQDGLTVATEALTMAFGVPAITSVRQSPSLPLQSLRRSLAGVMH